MKRTHHCAQLTKADLHATVSLAGWVDSLRDHGGIIFVDLRDRQGITQVKFDGALREQAAKLKDESVIGITGKVAPRPADMVNKNLPTGEVEVDATELVIHNLSETPPFPLDDAGGDKVNEDLRLTYRYLDLRRPKMRKNLAVRHRATKAVRDYFDAQGFYEIETPILFKSTPEGAREYLVPSRIWPGQFYALSQSPQQFKQILQVAGTEKYFQIARCFRDEDLRADRQPEFTQLDVEMSFVQPDDIFNTIEPLIVECFKVAGIEPPATPFQRMSYSDAMNRFGSDKPDLRFGMEFVDLAAQFENGPFPVFADVLKKGGAVKGLVVPGAAAWSRKQFDDIVDHARKYGAGGLAYIQVLEGESKSALAKFLGADGMNAVAQAAGAKPGDALLMIGGKWDVTCNALGQVRLEIGRREKLIDENENRLLWVVNFPMFEYHEEDKRWYAMHHPFTSPTDEDLDKLESGDLGTVRAKAYDLVFNGVELGGGSIRIHRSDVQARMFTALGLSEAEAREKFGFFLDALSYGTPPHGGIALGLDRMAMLFAGAKSLRDVIAFPKVASGSDLMTDSPSEVSPAQLAELKIKSLA